MIQLYTVTITDQAYQQILDIGHYIAFRIQAPDTALRLMDLIKESINSLQTFPQHIALVDDEPMRSLGIHRMPVKNYYIYFIINEKQHTVRVTAVIYSRRDQKKQLAYMNLN